MKTCALFLAAMGMMSLMLVGCSTEPATDAGKQNLTNDSGSALNDLKTTDPSLNQVLSSAYGYAIFPSIGKGAVGVGGAYGRGEVYEQGNKVGYADMTQATVGASLGGMDYAELIVFQSKQAMENFKAGSLTFDAQAVGTALKAGAAASAPYQNGVAIFIQTKGGLMGDASIGGQKFNFQPM